MLFIYLFQWLIAWEHAEQHQDNIKTSDYMIISSVQYFVGLAKYFSIKKTKNTTLFSVKLVNHFFFECVIVFISSIFNCKLNF